MSILTQDDYFRADRTGVLDLNGRGLIAVPAGVEQLPSLKILDLSCNLLTELPQAAIWPANLKEINLSDNAITTIPAAIAGLYRLERLLLEGNQLAALPDGITRLTSLRELDLSRNPLSALPPGLADMVERGLQLYLDGTPFAEAARRAAARGPGALAAYLRSLEDGVAQYEAKVLLVGEGNVGKTSLVTALCGEAFEADRPTTHGIEIREHSLPHPTEDVAITIRMWDFGGQEVYRTTHQFFFSERALYLVVWNPREGQEQNEVEGWLRRIRLRIGPQAAVLIVATHHEERRAELDYPRLRREFGTILRGQFAVDSRTGKGIDNLRAAIARKASLLPQMGQSLSVRWAAARDAVLARSTRVMQIPYAEFARECRKRRVSEIEQEHFANLLHDLGQIVRYGDDDGLRDIVVLNPEWLTKAISAVLEDETTRTDLGVLDHARLRMIWAQREDGPAYPRELHPYFLRLMEKFEISYRLEDGQHSLVAQLVPYERPELPWESFTAPDPTVRVLRLVCKLGEPAPPGLISWLTVRHHADSTERHWRAGVFLRHPVDAYKSEALLELRTDRELTLDVRAPSPDLYFHVLRESIEHLLRTRWPGLTSFMAVPCPTGVAKGDPCPDGFPLSTLTRLRELSRSEITCHTCVDDHDVSALLTGFHAGAAAKRPDMHVEALGAAQAADAALALRLLLETAELQGFPRLFTITTRQRGMMRWLRPDRTHLRLTLWCEQPGQQHPVGAGYEFLCTSETFRDAAPYLGRIFGLLRVVAPVAGALTGVPIPDLAAGSRDELDRMRTIVSALPRQGERGDNSDSTPVSSAEGEGLRALQLILAKEDPGRVFGGLRTVRAPAGELLWVCQEHRRTYDPGLPVLPN